VAGIGCVNQVEIAHLRADAQADLVQYAFGALLAIGAVACWTWYPIRNADWLRAHAGRSPRAWATAQGLVTLPLALAGYAGFWLWTAATGTPFSMPFDPEPQAFFALMLTSPCSRRGSAPCAGTRPASACRPRWPAG
jgi:drug/metabolite transporter (DMT)-like permease